MKKYLPIVLICVSAIIAFFKKSNNNTHNDPPKPKNEQTTTDNNPPSKPSENPTKVKDFGDLRFHNKPVVLTQHAKCRMGCRQIDASEIQEMLDKGTINQRKSGQSKDESTCPTVALEGKTHDAQTVRIVVAECADKAKIVTVIDLKNEFKCDCK
jgi:hypothetical protein